jgi:putative addiction module killer protein
VHLREYVGETGSRPFGSWFDKLDPQAAVKINAALERMTQGHAASVKGVGAGVLEYRIDFGPGYRVYFGRDGDEIVILLGGGTKKRQQKDIETAQSRWADYKQRKKEAR